MARIRVEVPVDDNAHPVKAESATVPEQVPAVTRTQPNRHGLTFKRSAVAVGILLLILFVNNLVQDKNRLEQQLQGGQFTSQDNAKEIVSHLAKSVELPLDEVPQMRVIEDAGKFTEQNPSLADIKNGDVLLFFEKSKKVVVYRPNNKKAVVVVTLSQPATDQTTTGE